MTPLVELLNETARLWWLNLSQAAWQSSLLACLLIALILWGRRWPSPLRYGLVLLALVKFAVPPTLPAPTSIFGWFDRAPAVAEPLPVTPAVSLLRASAPTTTTAATAPVVIPEERPRLHWQVWLMLLHGLGMAGFAFRVVRRLGDLRRIAAEARPVEDGPLREIFGELGDELGVRRPARLLVSAQPQPPVAFGLRQPTVIISEEMLDQMSIEEVKVVLAHELAHHRRGDLWLNWLQIFLAVVWWFNPVYHWLSRIVRGVREDCCDDFLLAESLTTNKSYCDALLHTAGVVSSPMILGDALGFADRLHPLGRRLTRIMDGTLRRSRRLSWAGALLIVLVACLTLPGKALVVESPKEEAAALAVEERVVEEPPVAPLPVPERRDEAEPAAEPVSDPGEEPSGGEEPVREAEPSGEEPVREAEPSGEEPVREAEPSGEEPVRVAEPGGTEQPPSRDPEAVEETGAESPPESPAEGENEAATADGPEDSVVREGSAAFRVIVNASNPQVTLERKQLAKMFLGRKKQWDHGTKVTAVDQLQESPVRAGFTAAIHGRKVATIKSYWKNMIFSGREVPPPEVSSDEEVIAFVRGQPGGVGYVSADVELVAGVKELLVTGWSENFAVRDDPTAFKVIVHASNPQTALERAQISKMFLKKKEGWEHGARVIPVDQLQESPVRAGFTAAIHGRGVATIKAYWEKMIFSGREVPPRELSSDEEVIAFVRGRPDGVGYVSADAELVAGVKELRVVE